jgi:hypothetical protein
MECQCTHVEIMYDSEAEEYAAKHLVEAAGELVCPATGARWRLERRGDQLVLRQIEPEKHLSRRPQS